ncbi:hypothetical protein YSA_09652 [Pseudomonas putida ND6]|uniref:Uncharacterized protein n=1 Tax=Pseudomonas putida ND6 TaxID=231023 RepID=I3V2N6_PSEPU|nr:hypothetical protein YSA_09652 [Pseudomonas putida ND6]
MGIFIASDHGVTPMPNRGSTVESLCIHVSIRCFN